MIGDEHKGGSGEEKCGNGLFRSGRAGRTHLINTPSFQSHDIAPRPTEGLNFSFIFAGVINGLGDYVQRLNESKKNYSGVHTCLEIVV